MICATILTFNLYENDRVNLFSETYASLSENDVLVIPVDNGSSDGTQDWIRELGGYCYRGRTTTSGHGTNLQARVAIGSGADLCVLSDDDMFWPKGWSEDVEAYFDHAPKDIVLVGCHLEPEFPWNQIAGVEPHGGIRSVIRASTGAASWAFRAGDWPKIGPVPDRIQGHGDVPACDRIRENGYRIAQLDIAEHRGQGRSSWGNRTEALYGWDLDPVRARLEAS